MNKPFSISIASLATLLFFACTGQTGANRDEPASGQTDQEYRVTGSVLRLQPEMDDIIPPGAVPEIVAEGFDWSEGPLWLPDQSFLIFSDIPKNSIYQWSEEGGLKLYLRPAGYTGSTPRGGESGSNGLLLHSSGKLVLCQHGDRRMALMDAPLNDPAPQFITLADKWSGKRFNSPNDAVYNSKGDLYFTDPAYGLEKRYQDPSREMDFTGVFRLSAEGNVSLVTDKLGAPNGIGFAPDEKTLYVANSGGGKNSFWMAYDLNEQGEIAGERLFYDASIASDTLVGAPDGLKVRNDGIIFATGPGGVWIFNSSGKHLGIIKTGQPTSNCALNANQHYLYMTANMYLMRIQLKK